MERVMLEITRKDKKRNDRVRKIVSVTDVLERVERQIKIGRAHCQNEQ